MLFISFYLIMSEELKWEILRIGVVPEEESKAEYSKYLELHHYGDYESKRLEIDTPQAPSVIKILCWVLMSPKVRDIIPQNELPHIIFIVTQIEKKVQIFYLNFCNLTIKHQDDPLCVTLSMCVVYGSPQIEMGQVEF